MRAWEVLPRKRCVRGRSRTGARARALAPGPRDRAAEGGRGLRGSYIKLLRQKRTRRRSTEPPGCTWGPSWWHGEAHRCPTCGPQTRSRTARNSKRRRRMALSLQSLPSLLHIGYTKSNTGCQHAYSRVRARKCLWSATPCFYSALDVVEKILRRSHLASTALVCGAWVEPHTLTQLP